MSLFITFEGGEGSGKSTQAEMLHRRLKEAGYTSILVREPGTTALGQYLREWLIRERRKKEDAISPRAELFMFETARAEFVAKILKPNLSIPQMIVISDRYVDSTTAYQGHGRRLPLKDIATLNQIVTEGLMPAVTFLLDCPPEEGLRRVGSAQIGLEIDPSKKAAKGRLDEAGTRRFEKESVEFHKRVHHGYFRVAQDNPERVKMIDAMRTRYEISDEIWAALQPKLTPDLLTRGGSKSGETPLWSARGDAGPQKGGLR